MILKCTPNFQEFNPYVLFSLKDLGCNIKSNIEEEGTDLGVTGGEKLRGVQTLEGSSGPPRPSSRYHSHGCLRTSVKLEGKHLAEFFCAHIPQN